MPKPKRSLLATVEDTVTPPDTLSSSQAIARIVKAAGKNLYNAELPNGKPVLVELEARFRSAIWIKRGSYVIVDHQTLAERDNKWPKEFAKKSTYVEDSDDEGSTVGKMPPSDLDEE